MYHEMGSVCADQHKFHASHHLYLGKKPLRDTDIPPRKLAAGRRTSVLLPFDPSCDFFVDTPKAEEALLQKFLPYNNVRGGGDDEEEDDDGHPYSSDHFRMYEFKVRRCTRSRSHDWTDCPFAHPGEKARRRDPRKFYYSGTVCSDFRRGACRRGDNCEFAHGVFECWLHPDRYRTEACKDGKDCKRKVCFFAHTPRQLRILPVHCNNNSPSPLNSPVNSPIAVDKVRYHNNANHCCVYCHSLTASPTSTLVGMCHLSPPMSPTLSPPHSPLKAPSLSGFSTISRYSDSTLGGVESCGLTHLGRIEGGYKDILTELMSSMEAMNVNEGSNSPGSANSSRSLSWADVIINGDDPQQQFIPINGDDPQQQFIPSTLTSNPPGSRNFFIGDCSGKSFMDDNIVENGSAGPNLEWVNELLT